MVRERGTYFARGIEEADQQRTWISWLRCSVLMGTLSLALFNSASYFAPEPVPPPFEPGPEQRSRLNTFRTIRTFGVIYALISVSVLLWGLYSYQRRVTLIKSKWPGSFGKFFFFLLEG